MVSQGPLAIVTSPSGVVANRVSEDAICWCTPTSYLKINEHKRGKVSLTFDDLAASVVRNT